jgi:hypothetical protein
MACGGDARCTVHITSHIPLLGQKRRPRVYADPHLDRAGGEHLGDLPGGRNRSRRGREAEEERVPLRIDLDAVVAGAGRSDQATMLGQCFRIPLGAELVEQPRRALNVGEEEGDRSRREITPHNGIMRQSEADVPEPSGLREARLPQTGPLTHSQCRNDA